MIFGPVVRSHEFGLQKKVRRLGLKTALSAKQAEGKLVVIDEARLDEAKTKALRSRFEALGWGSVLIIDGAGSTRVLPAPRATCRRSMCCRSRAPMSTTSCAATRWCLTRAAVQQLEARLK